MAEKPPTPSSTLDTFKMKHFLLFIFLFLLSANIFCQDNRYDRMSFWTKMEVENLEVINSEEEEFSPYIWGDYLIYIGIQEKSVLENKTKIFKQNQADYFDLKASLLKPESDLPRFVFSNELNSKFHEGPVSWDKYNKRLYFTRANSVEEQAVVDDQGRQQLLIYQADYAQGKWSSVAEVSFSFENETFCHPAIFDKGNKMILASPKLGGMGKMDLYISFKQDDQSWSPPNNLGNQINQLGNQWFPFVINDKDLFYASDIGDGQGLDIYYAKLDQDGNVINSQRLPFPINTSYDDFALVFSEDGSKAYFSSNRSGGKGKDDVYSIRLK